MTNDLSNRVWDRLEAYLRLHPDEKALPPTKIRSRIIRSIGARVELEHIAEMQRLLAYPGAG